MRRSENKPDTELTKAQLRTLRGHVARLAAIAATRWEDALAAENYPGEPSVWRSRLPMRAEPHHVIDCLTEVEACQAWSPVNFELDETNLLRLRAGTRVGVTGSLVGQRVRFCLEVFEANAERLRLRAAGPVDLIAEYEVHPVTGGSHVDAALSVRRRPGRFAAAVTRVTTVLLSGGVLERTLVRVAREAERRQESAGLVDVST